MSHFLDRLASFPPVALYLTLGLAAALENIFPPLPADTVVAFGSFLAARGNGTALGAFLSTLTGNLAGAALMYGAGRKYGADRMERRLLGNKGPSARARLRALYDRYGMVALFLSRFVPGLRAVVPPFAGALRLPAIPPLVVMGVASAIWYGAISYLAFRVGSNFERLQQTIGVYGRTAGIVAAVLIAIGLVVWLIRRRRGAAR
jgi:membrane protein DedA with SNARE-associated domain